MRAVTVATEGRETTCTASARLASVQHAVIHDDAVVEKFPETSAPNPNLTSLRRCCRDHARRVRVRAARGGAGGGRHNQLGHVQAGLAQALRGGHGTCAHPQEATARLPAPVRAFQTPRRIVRAAAGEGGVDPVVLDGGVAAGAHAGGGLLPSHGGAVGTAHIFIPLAAPRRITQGGSAALIRGTAWVHQWSIDH